MVTQNEDSAWNACIQLWEGVASFGCGDTADAADAAARDCAVGPKLLFEHFAGILPGEPGHVSARA